MVGLLGEFTDDVIHRARASESDSDADSEGATSKRALLAKQRTLEEVLRTLGARATRLEDDARRADQERSRRAREMRVRWRRRGTPRTARRARLRAKGTTSRRRSRAWSGI
jgi:hypothetical protein